MKERRTASPRSHEDQEDMAKLLLVVLALGCAGAAPVENDMCQPHSRPWQAYLRNTGTGNGLCTGALINQWWVLTSFDCAFRLDRTTVSLGEHDVTVEEGTEQNIPVAKIVFHSPYRSPLHSLALLKLAKPARFTQFVQPIPLPTRCPQANEQCLHSGWGPFPDRRLKCLPLPVIDNWECQNFYPMEWSYMFCAGNLNSTLDRYLDDIGSTLVCGGQLQGVLWYGHNYDPESVRPDSFSRLCDYRNWIDEVINTPDTTPTPTPPMTTDTAAL